MATKSPQGLQAFIAEIASDPLPSFAAADVLRNPIDIYRSYLARLFQTLVECDPDIVYDSIQPANTTGNGDLDVVLPRLKVSGISPKDLAGELLKKFQPHPLFALPFKDGVHLRFFFSTKSIPRLLLPYINDRRGAYGGDTSLGLREDPSSGRRKVLVEFSSPNIARDFTAAHLKSTILGAFVANIYEAMGWDVVRINYLGDWGKHLGLLGVGWQKYGSERTLDEQEDPFRYIHDLYTKMEEELEPEQEARRKAREDGQDGALLESRGLFAERDANFKKMEDGEPEAIALWKKIRDISIEYYVSTYARLNIKFDEYSGESKVSINPNIIAEVETVLKSKGIYEEQNDAWVIDYDKHGAKLGLAIVRGRNGSTTYLLRDIATLFDRVKTYSFDKMFYVVGEQDVHFRQVFKAVELMGHADIAGKLEHITFAKPIGSSFNSGKAQLLGDVLGECENNMRNVLNANQDQYPFDNHNEAAKSLGINSLIIQELYSKKGHSNSISFSLTTLAEGEELQLCYSRLCSAIGIIGVHATSEEIPHLDYSSLWEEPWCDLLRLMARYPGITSSAFGTLDPGMILSYLFLIAEELTACLDEAEEDESNGEGSAAGSKYAARAVVYENVRHVIENGMKLLGITPFHNWTHSADSAPAWGEIG